MKMFKRSALVVAVFLGSVMTQSLSHATEYFFLGENPLEVKGKLDARASIRADKPEGWTFPKVAEGNLIQQRNLALIELNQTLAKQTETTGEIKYHIVGRALYDGVYDYGPKGFKDVRNNNKEEIDDFKKDAQVWEAYFDYTKGPVFFRVGRQNLSWGETDIFRLLDRINPLDDTFGGTFEDLDDRRIPIWMVRGMYNFGNVGPVSALTLEGFFNPGMGEQKVAPYAPYGTAYAFPTPPPSIPTRIHTPEKTFDSSRMGIRLGGVIGDNYNFSLAQYRTLALTSYASDIPPAVVTFDPSAPGGPAFQDIYYKNVWITGASLNFYEPHLKGVVRSEVAWFWKEPVFIPQINAPLLFGNFESGKIPEKDVLRYMVGFDKNFWVRSLNDKSMMNVFLQYFAEYYPSFDDRQRIPLNKFPNGEFMNQVRYDQKITLIGYTSYMEGTLTPQLAVAYDPRRAWLVIPSIEKKYDPWGFKLAYSGIWGKEDVSLGILRDRKQVSFNITRNF